MFFSEKLPTFDLPGFGRVVDRFWRDGIVNGAQTMVQQQDDSQNSFDPTARVIKLYLNYCFIDIEGFRAGKRPMLIKEIAWFNLSTLRGDNIIFRFNSEQAKDLTPSDWKQMKYFTKFIHGMPFFYGSQDYSALAIIIRVIQSQCQCLITKGAEKAVILGKLFNLPIIDLGETEGTPSYFKLATNFPIPDNFWCDFHKKQKTALPHCAMTKINLLLSYVLSRNISKP